VAAVTCFETLSLYSFYDLTLPNKPHQKMKLDKQGEDVKVFVDMANGIWFGGVNKNQYGSISSSRLSDRAAIE